MGLREWPPGIEFENLSPDQFKLEDVSSTSRGDGGQKGGPADITVALVIGVGCIDCALHCHKPILSPRGAGEMSESFFERPILNSPYEVPRFHHALDGDGQPLDLPPVDGQRQYHRYGDGDCLADRLLITAAAPSSEFLNDLGPS